MNCCTVGSYPCVTLSVAAAYMSMIQTCVGCPRQVQIDLKHLAIGVCDVVRCA